MEDAKLTDLTPKNTLVIPKNTPIKQKGIYLDSKNDNLRITENGLHFYISDDYYYDEELPTNISYPNLNTEEFETIQNDNTIEISNGPINFIEYFLKLVDLINLKIKNKKIKKVIVNSTFSQLNLLTMFRKIYPKYGIFLYLENKIIIDKLTK